MTQPTSSLSTWLRTEHPLFHPKPLLEGSIYYVRQFSAPHINQTSTVCTFMLKISIKMCLPVYSHRASGLGSGRACYIVPAVMPRYESSPNPMLIWSEGTKLRAKRGLGRLRKQPDGEITSGQSGKDNVLSSHLTDRGTKTTSSCSKGSYKGSTMGSQNWSALAHYVAHLKSIGLKVNITLDILLQIIDKSECGATCKINDRGWVLTYARCTS